MEGAMLWTRLEWDWLQSVGDTSGRRKQSRAPMRRRNAQTRLCRRMNDYFRRSRLHKMFTAHSSRAATKPLLARALGSTTNCPVTRTYGRTRLLFGVQAEALLPDLLALATEDLDMGHIWHVSLGLNNFQSSHRILGPQLCAIGSKKNNYYPCISPSTDGEPSNGRTRATVPRVPSVSSELMTVSNCFVLIPHNESHGVTTSNSRFCTT